MADVKKIENEYKPDWVTHPGETLLDLLEERGMTQVQLADRTGRPKKTINEIVKGKASITPETAIQLERVFRISASFWVNRQRNYDEAVAKQASKAELQNHVSWLESFRIRELVRLGWIKYFKDKIEQLNELLRFFGVNSPEEWQTVWGEPKAAYRQSRTFERNPEATAAWLRRGQLVAENIRCAPYSRAGFRSILQDLRSMTLCPPKIFESEIREKCASVGVAVVFIQRITGVPLTGATRWLNPNKALIQLSLRGKWEDIMWFTFYHEAGHILLHGKTEMFIEGERKEDKREKEADLFARDELIPPPQWSRFIEGDTFQSEEGVGDFAKKLSISPAIVVGRLQHERKIPHYQWNDLRRKYIFAN